MRLQTIIILAATITLSACTTAQEPNYTWVKGKLGTRENEYLIADSSCEAESYKTIPIDNSSQLNCTLMSAGFAKGMCNGSVARQNKNMAELRHRVYEGCMLNKGWHKEPNK